MTDRTDESFSTSFRPAEMFFCDNVSSPKQVPFMHPSSCEMRVENLARAFSPDSACALSGKGKSAHILCM